MDRLSPCPARDGGVPLNRRLVALALASLSIVACPARPAADDLKVDLRIDVPVILAVGSLAVGLSLPRFAPSRCRVCGAGEVDEDARELLRLRDPALQSDARHLSDILVSGVIPAGALAASAIWAYRDGDARELLDDAVVVTESLAIAADLTAVTKDAVARQRPDPANQHGARNESFFSGHASAAFSVATAAATVATIRGRPDAPWMWIAGETLATGVAYLRVAGDAHWLSDVVAGAAVGGAVGFAVPWLFHRARGVRRRVDVRPAPGGLALVF